MAHVAVEDWPMVLAGPMVRRVEPGLVAVWVALSEARHVRLTVFEGPTDTGSGTGTFTGGTPVISGDTNTVRVGEHLHVAVVTAAPKSGGGSLTAGQTYAYNVAFGEPGSPLEPGQDLKSLNLLRDLAGDPTATPPVLRHVALGYEPNRLPTFVLPPTELAKLRIAHGSCRRAHAECNDMIPALDALIRDGRSAIEQRPQQLFLTGDQIYADDVAPSILHLANPLGNALLGVVEQLPTTWSLQPSQGVRLEPAVASRFPAGLRKAVVRDDARLTTVDGESHLLSFGEYLAMHLLSYSNVLWPAALPTYGELFWTETLADLEGDEILAGLTLPPDIWRIHTGLGFATRYGVASDQVAEHPNLDFEAIDVGAQLTRIATDEKRSKEYGEQLQVVAAFRDALPEARRVFANIATYMICDDHEITDDWNLSQLWKDRVYTAPLGRTVLRNGILAYFVCQGWGNDPAAFDVAGSKKAELLAALPGLFPAGEDLPPVETTAKDIDLLLGLDGKDPPVTWHYRVDGPKHRVLVMDTRSRRSYRDRVAPPTNLSSTALEQVVPAGPLPTGLEVLFVVAPLPVFGLPLSDEVAGPLIFRAYDAFKVSEISSMPGTNPDAAEAWANDPVALEALLKRLAPYRRIVVLSGDVHYANSGDASYWRKDDAQPSRFAQFTSSGVKNVWPHPVLTLSRSFGLSQPLERVAGPVELLGWDDDSPDPLTLPAGAELLPPARARLRAEPVLLPTHGWPDGTKVARPPDWTWRFRLGADARPDGELPEPARPAALDDDAPDADVAVTIEGVRKAARRHARQLDKVSFTRQVLFESNVGIVTFDTTGGRTTVKQELHARPDGAAKVEVYTSHSIVLAPAPADPPEVRPTIGSSA
jgi:hypothetical protein